MTNGTFNRLLKECTYLTKEISLAHLEFLNRELAGSNDHTEVRTLLLDAEESCKTLLKQIQAELG